MKIFFAVATIVFLSGCAYQVNVTYRSHGTTYASLETVKYAVIKGQFNMKDQTNSQVAVVNATALRIGNIESVITGSLLKNGISTMSSDELSELPQDQHARCIIVEWGISGRNSRGIGAGYSQEVTVLIKNALSGELVYKGIGEYMGQTEIDDLKGALLAALKDFRK
ncbi:MAG: hypothetical protein V1800_15665 [Candidatus Latescibacterota bacterium]